MINFMVQVIQVIGSLVPIVGIIALFYKKQSMSSMYLILTNIGCLIMNALTFKEKSAIITLISKLSRKHFLLPMIKTNPMMQRNLFCRMYHRFIVS